MRRLILLTALAFFIFMTGVVSAAEDAKASAVKVTPKKVDVDSNFDGKVDRTEIYDAKGQITRIEIDNNGDAKIDEWIVYENGKPSQDQRDSNYDGKVDVWIDY